MTKRFVVAVSFISVVLGLLAQTPARGDMARHISAPPAPALSTVTVGASFLIEPPMADYVRDLDQREQREQIRDWAVLGTLSRFGVTPAQLAAATYQMPPARLPYLDELYAFEYGRGRRAYLGNRVLLFRDADDPDPQATIGRLADRVRMENDELPKLIEVYLIDDQRDVGMIRVERAADVTRDALFSKAYGYIAGEARDSGQLSAWLGQVDDLTYAKIADDGRLLLGGRRFPGTRTANIAAEDVAAIYQAHQLLDQRRSDARKKLNGLPSSARDAIVQHLALLREQRPDAKADALAEAPEAVLRMVPPVYRDQLLAAIRVAYTADPSPGFSLDPTWLPDPAHPEHPLFLARLRAFAGNPCGDLERTAQKAIQLVRQEPDEARRTSRTVVADSVRAAIPPSGLASVDPDLCSRLKALFSPALEALISRLDGLTPGSWDRGMSIYHQFVQEFQQRAPAGRDYDLVQLGMAGLQFHEEDTRVQCARYEGVDGTRVGMTLFYTDLLAKLWEVTDFARSAPIAEVPGFLSQPHMDLPKVFGKEDIENPYTRLWFGARSGGVSRSVRDTNTVFLFDHRFSRIYAASSNPARPRVEVRPGEGSRRALGWWNRHFDEVADYEQEYHRQNQIMKWALVAGAVTTGTLADGLGKFSVSHGFQFTDWQRSNRASLRFAETLPLVSQGIAGKECIPLLSSYDFRSFGHGMILSGGVATTSRAASYTTPIADVTKPLGARVPSVADLEVGTSGTIPRARPVLSGESVTFEGSPQVRVRGAGGDVSLGAPRVDYVQGSGRGSLAIRAGEGKTAIGEVGTEVTKKNVAIRWSEGAIERSRLGKPEPGAATLENADKMAKQGFATDAAKIYERGLPNDITEANKLAREVIADIAHRRSAVVASKLEKLAAQGKQLSPEARDALVNTVRRESEPLARRFETAVRLDKPLSEPGVSVVTERGRVLLTRDIGQLPRVSTPKPMAELSNSVVYVDSRLVVAREGLLPNTGGQVARWIHLRGVKVVELKADSIGALPDRFVETSTGLTVQRAPGPLPKSLPGLPPTVLVIQKCDAGHETATTSDDC